jgi:rhomboid protease GluP
VGVNDDTCYGCGRRNPSLWGFAPALRALGGDLGFVPFVIGTCVVLYGTTLLITIRMGFDVLGGRSLNILTPNGLVMLVFGASGGSPVFEFGMWWTPLSAGWLHWGLIHILFNMFALRQLAPGTAEIYGPGRMVIIYTAAGVAGFALSTVSAAYFPRIPLIGGGSLAAGIPHLTAGASASIAGLVGALLHYGQRGGSGMARAYASQYILYMAIYGLMFAGIDNYAHLGGFAGGYLAARVLDPLRPERVDHIVIALICLAASLGAVVASFILRVSLLRQG